MDEFTFLFNGDFTTLNGPKLTLNDFAIKIQGGPGGDSFEVPGQPIPEPLTILGAGTAAGFGAFFKRRLKRQS